jgi:predicted MFS family arabinose efflux permease
MLEQVKQRKVVVILLGFIGFLTNGDIYSAAPMMINIAADLNISVSSAILSMTAYMFAFGLFTIILGPLGDRYGRTNILIISSFSTAIFSCLSVFAFNLPVLIILRFANGAFAAGIMPISMAIVGGLYNDSDRQSAIAKLMGMMFLGGASGTIIGGALSYVSSWRLVYLVYGIGELFLSFYLLKYLEKSAGTVGRLNYFKIYGQALNNKKLLVILSIIMLIGFSVFGSFTFSGELIKQITNLNVLQIGLILSIFGISGIAGARLVPKLRPILGNSIVLSAGILGSLSIFSLSILNSIPFLMLAISGYGITFICIHSIFVATAQNTIPKLRGTIMSLVSFSVFVGSGFGTALYRQLMDSVGITLIFQVAAVIFLVVGISGFITLNALQNKIGIKGKK